MIGRNLRNRLLIILGVVVASVYFTYPLEERINKGLDLEGGMHLVLQVQTDDLPEDSRDDAVSKSIEILRNRIDSIGASEPVIVRQGANQILVQLPGVTDRKKA